MWTLVVYMFWSTTVTAVTIPGYGSDGLCSIAGDTTVERITQAGGSAFYVCIEVLQ